MLPPNLLVEHIWISLVAAVIAADYYKAAVFEHKPINGRIGATRYDAQYTIHRNFEAYERQIRRAAAQVGFLLLDRYH